MEDYKTDDEVVILDFETTGLSADYERVIEVGAAVVKEGEIQSTFCSLCNPRERIPYAITALTGITNEMLDGQPSPEQVMEEFYHYLGDRPLIAHNASFDSRFLHAEMGRIDKALENPFLCTMLLSRRLIPDAENHKLGTLKRHVGYKEDEGHRDHRALDDVKVTAALWTHLTTLVTAATGRERVDFSVLQGLSRLSRHKVQDRLEQLSVAGV